MFTHTHTHTQSVAVIISILHVAAFSLFREHLQGAGRRHAFLRYLHYIDERINGLRDMFLSH